MQTRTYYTRPRTFKKKMDDSDIQNVIEQRLQLQTYQRLLSNQFPVYEPSLRAVTQPHILLQFEQWDQDKRNDFVRLLGGPVNMKFTYRYLNGLVNKLKEQMNKKSV